VNKKNRFSILKEKAEGFTYKYSEKFPVSFQLTHELLPIFEENYKNRRKPGSRAMFAQPFVEKIVEYLKRELGQVVDIKEEHLCRAGDAKFKMDIAIVPKDKNMPTSFISCKITIDTLAYRETFATAYFLRKHGEGECKTARYYILGTHPSSKSRNTMSWAKKMISLS